MATITPTTFMVNSMFKTRHNKTFPQGTFIPTKARIAAILQLCLAFTVSLWIISQPFMPDYFAIRSEMVILDHLFGTGTYTEEKELYLERNAERFARLPKKEKSVFEKRHKELQALQKRTFQKKIFKSLEMITSKTPPFLQAWIIFSIVIPILLLLKIEGAACACWILPLLALLMTSHADSPSAHCSLFPEYPTERLLLETFLRQPLKPTISQQYNQLEKGWHLYLIKEWAQEVPSKNRSQRILQIEKGEFAFHCARAKQQAAMPELLPSDRHITISKTVLWIFIAWNSIFAAIATYDCQRRKKIITDPIKKNRATQTRDVPA